MKTVSQLMTSKVVTLRPDASVAAAIQTMLAHHVSGIPVLDGYAPVGIVTARDLLGKALYRLVGDVMTADPATIAPDDPITAAYALMDERGIGRLPVVEEGRLVGIITRLDILHELGKLTDPMTGLPWAGTLRQHAADLVARGEEIVVMFIDLDRFRQVNKRHGHVIGDRLIVTVAGLLRGALDPDRDLLCRYGGDEFAVVTTRRAEDADRLARHIQAELQSSATEGLDGVAVAASIGLAGGRRAGERADIHPGATVDDLINMASRASSAAKQMDQPILHVADMQAMEILQRALPDEETRLRLAAIGLTMEADRASARVELVLEDRRYTGTAEGSPIGHGPLRALAQAAADALEQLLPGGWHAEVEEIAYTSMRSGDAVSVALVLASPTGEEILLGTVPYGRNRSDAVVKATLKAVNRRLGRLLAMHAARIA